MNKKEKLKQLLDKLNSLQKSGSSLDETGSMTEQLIKEELSNVTSQLKGIPTIKVLEKIDAELAKFRKEFDLKPVVKMIEEFEGEISEAQEGMAAEFQGMQAEFNEKLQELSDLIGKAKVESSDLTDSKFQPLVDQLLSISDENSARDRAMKESAAQVQEMIFDLKASMKNMASELESIPGSNQSLLDKAKQEVRDELENKVERLRMDFLSKLSSIGGGNQNRQILANSSVLSSKYADINFIGGDNVAITASDDDTNKRVNVTFDSSALGIGDTISGGTEGSVLFVGPGSALAQDNANFFWDNTNDRLGLRTSAPTHTLTLASTGNGIALYNTADQTTNYERLTIGWSSNTAYISSGSDGTGTSRTLILAASTGDAQAIGNHRISINTGSPSFDFSVASGDTSAIYIRFASTIGASSGSQTILSLSPTVNQSGSAGYVGLLINPTETATGSGTKALIEAQVGGVDRFMVENTGITTITNVTDAASNLALILQSDRATPTDNDEVYLSFKVSDSAGNQDEAARISGRLSTVASGSENGRLLFSVLNAGSLSNEMFLTAGGLYPVNNDGLTLGLSSNSWADLFLASGGVINWANGDVTLTHSTDTLTVGGGNLVVNGGLSLPISTKTTAYTAVASDYTILCDATTAGFTITLPAAASNSGRIYNIKKIDSTGNVVTIDGNASETIDGATTQTLDAQWEAMTIQSNGTNWFIIAIN